MSLKTFVKISNINNLSDARYCAGMYVNLMGFNLEQNHEDFISPEKFKEITDWLSGLEFVAEFETAHPDTILSTIQEYSGIKFIEIQEEIHLKMLVNSGYGLILKVTLNEESEIDEIIAKADSYKDFEVAIHLHSLSLELKDSVIQKIKELSNNCEVLLGFGLEPDTVEEIIKDTGIKGICLQGGHEIKPGLKDFDDLADILEALEVED
ncbi:phosphoribosylanthranilate isomerase [Belliella buryatensis]|uniref:Phosphoribosylanthranilate isomerase n=1 Tax=Belliella buryatensis TaxID=1500549 RepID=A0A239D6R3_9BACT|nr:phosphoribosylanthranilate isomerase [Belliella buryatensis]SNS27554.1 phosphoribosylanthranilate isomerase [Belliella buryatensis]